MSEEEQVTDTEAEAVEEQTSEVIEQKDFSEMTEDEKLALPDDELMKHLSEEETTETPTEKEGEFEGVDTEDKSEEGKKDEEGSEYDEISGMTEEEFNALPKNKKGLFFEMRKDRNKRQDLERELDKERAVKEGQKEMLENFHKMQGKEPAQKFESDYQRVMADIEAKAQAYEEETGEDYRLTLKDQRAIDAARDVDTSKQQQERESEAKNEQQKQSRQVLQSRITQGEEELKSQGVEDYDFVYKNFVLPQINPDVAKNPQLAMANAQILINLAISGENPAKYAYETLASMSPEGAKYFREKQQQEKNRALKSEAGKTTTKTSSHVQTKSAGGGKTLVTMSKVNGNFDYWVGKLNEDQFKEVAEGREVYI